MSLASTPIRTAIAELLEGSLGSIRTVTATKFLRGVFDGQPEQATAALTAQTSTARHRFDVELGAFRTHSASPVSALSNYRIAECDVTIRVKTKLATANQTTQRATDIAAILDDCDLAAQALGRPGNLTQTAGATATNLIGGCLVGPDGSGTPRIERTDQEWSGPTGMATTLIVGRALVKISQAVS